MAAALSPPAPLSRPLEVNQAFLVYDEDSRNFRKLNRGEPLTAGVIQKTWESFQKVMIEKIGAGRTHEEEKKHFLADCDFVRKKDAALTKRAFDMLSLWVQKQAPLSRIALPPTGLMTAGDLSEEFERVLLFEAQKVRVHLEGPSSHYPSGATLLTKRGEIYNACNMDSADSNMTLCAEKRALIEASLKIKSGISLESQKDIVAIALVSRGGGSLCKACRQMLYKDNPNIVVIMGDVSGFMKLDICPDPKSEESSDPKK